MEIEELFSRLDRQRGSFPNDLLAEAIARRQETTPKFLAILEEMDRNPEPWLFDERMVHIYAMYLLALFQEHAAYPLLVRIFSRPGEFPFEIAGDVVTQDLGRILASVSGGDPSGMVALIENEAANEWVRCVAIDAMTSLVTTGQLTREYVMAYFLRLFHTLERKPGAQWDGLANACADLWPQEAIRELARAYDDGLVDEDSIAWEDIKDAQACGLRGARNARSYRAPIIIDLARSMSWMQCFDADEPCEEGDEESESLEPWVPEYQSLSVRRTEPKIGRNHPCPCGSGKKFKKCCAAG